MNLSEEVSILMLPITVQIAFMREYDRALAIWDECMDDSQKSIYNDFYEFLECRIRQEILEKLTIKSLSDMDGVK